MKIRCDGCREVVDNNIDRVFCGEDYDKMTDDRDHWQNESIRLRHWLEKINAGLGTAHIGNPVLRLIKAQIGMALTGNRP
jgi:hypothetical protein